jgi:outer membrane biosynthesis protein TonB
MARVRALSYIAAVAAIVTLPVWTGACARVHARTAGPTLETPVPPARVIPKASPPIESQPIVASPPVGEVQPAEPTTINPPDNSTPPPPVPTPPPTPPPVATERPAQPAAAEPPPTLQTTADPTAAEQRTRASLQSATRDLGRIDVRTLSADAKAQYDLARRYVEQATDALNEKKFEFAQQLADKAATLAALLQRR